MKCKHAYTRNVPSGNEVHWGKAICIDCGGFVKWLPKDTYFSEILNVPYAEKDDAKKAGARWDKHLKVWYSPSPANISLLQKWRVAGNNFNIPKHVSIQPKKQVMTQWGLVDADLLPEIPTEYYPEPYYKENY